MSAVEKAGLFTSPGDEALKNVPAEYRPSSAKWVGIAARSTVFAYNTSKLTEAQLPKSLMDLADPSWKGRWAASPPSGADFQAIVSALVQLKGADAAETWLQAMKTNSVAYKGNSTAMKAVNAGEIDGAVIYTTTGSATRPPPARTRRTCSCTTSRTRIRVPSCPCPGAVC